MTPPRDSTGAIWKALNNSTPVVLIQYKDLEELGEMIDEVETLSNPDRPVVQVNDVETALQTSNTAVLLVPTNEAKAVDSLDGLLEHLIDRSSPLVLFLLNGGPGEEHLKSAPSLMSWLAGNIIDPRDFPPLDIEAARSQFEEKTGQNPENWLTENNARGTLSLTYRALLLESTHEK